MIPQTYTDWRRCIEVDCGLALTPQFITERINELADPGRERTAQFIRLYGDAHRQRVLGWFRQAAGMHA